MGEEEHKKYLREVSAFTKKILSSKTATGQFLIDTGIINTPTGKVTRVYTANTKTIGYRTKQSK